VKLDTNGSRPEMLARLLRAGLVDCVAMDVKAPWEKYDLLAGVKAPLDAVRESIRLIAGSGVSHHFRTTAPPSLLGARDLEVLRRELPAESPHRVQEFKPEHALDPAACVEARQYQKSMSSGGGGAPVCGGTAAGGDAGMGSGPDTGSAVTSMVPGGGAGSDSRGRAQKGQSPRLTSASSAPNSVPHFPQ
jgi:hypothetical protein